MKNNLFTYATSELSQDAFICWCANWLNDTAKPVLTQMAKEFITLLSEIEDVKTVSIFRQFYKIDVLMIVNEHTAVIVEDKTFTSNMTIRSTNMRQLSKR